LRGFASGYFFLGSLQNHFDISFSHGLTQIPMHEETTETHPDAAQVIEGAAQVDVGNVDMPVLMGLQRLLETGSLARWLASSTGIIIQLASTPAKTLAGTDGHNVSVEHHERQLPITFQRVLQMELDDCF